MFKSWFITRFAVVVAVLAGPVFAGDSGECVGLFPFPAGSGFDVQYGYIDCSGKTIVPAVYRVAFEFAEGHGVVVDDKGSAIVADDGIQRILDGVTVLTPFNEGLAIAQRGSKGFLIDYNGRNVGNLPDEFSGDDGMHFSVAAFSDGRAVVATRAGLGYIDRSGRWAIAPRFDDASRFSGGVAAVSVGGRFAVIDRQGKYVVKPGVFDVEGNAEPSDGWVRMRTKERESVYFDARGRIALLVGYDYAGEFSEGLAAVHNGSNGDTLTSPAL